MGHKTIFSPIFNRIRKSKRRKSHPLMGLDEAATKERRILRIREPHAEEVAKKKKTRWNSKKNFTKMCESR